MSPAPGAAGGAAPGAPQLTPITPPQRYSGSAAGGGGMGGMGGAFGGGSTPGGGMGMGTPLTGDMDRAARTPMSDSRRRSPHPAAAYSPGGAVVASPEQLSYFLDSLGGGRGVGGGAYGGVGATPSPQQPDAAAAAASAAAMYGYSPVTPGGYGTGQEQEPGTEDVLPVGANAPYYRMTWLPKKAAAASDPASEAPLAPTPPDEVEDFVVTVLRGRQDWLEVWTERLREWLALRVLRPLVAAVAGAHEGANALLAELGHPARLPPLPEVLSDGRAGGGAGAAGTPGGGGGTLGGGGAMGGGAGGGGAAEVDAALRALRGGLAAHVAGQPYAAGTPRVKELLAAVDRYAELLAVVRGRRPADLLPPSPPSYVWARCCQLAASTCLADFTWNGGAAHGGRPWSADSLPNDSALVLYLFAAFLDAPGWQFTAPTNTQAEGTPNPLHLGSLGPAPRGGGPFSAVLPHRPERPGRGLDALLGLGLATPQPLFAYLAGGRVAVLAHHRYAAVFHAILFFLQYHKVRYGGAVGRQQLSDPDLALEAVIAPPALGSLVGLGGRVWGWFT